MHTHIIAVGTKMPAWVTQGCEEYTKRLPKDQPISIIELPMAKRIKNGNIVKYKAQEAELIVNKIQPKSITIACDLSGKNWSTEQLAENLKTWRENTNQLNIIIGGPDGLDKRVLEKSQHTWCLSALTLPHPLVRVLLAEQLYRAHSYLARHPYHRG